MKKYIIAGAVLLILSVAYAIFKPAKIIETTRTIATSENKRVRELQKEINKVTSAKSVIERKLAEATEIAKNVNIHFEYYPDGKIKSKDIIDLSKTSIKSDSTSTATSTVTVSGKSKEATTETENKKTDSKETKTTGSDGLSFLFGPGVFVRTKGLDIKEYKIENIGLSAGLKIDNVLINLNYLFLFGNDDILYMTLQMKP